MSQARLPIPPRGPQERRTWASTTVKSQIHAEPPFRQQQYDDFLNVHDLVTRLLQQIVIMGCDDHDARALQHILHAVSAAPKRIPEAEFPASQLFRLKKQTSRHTLGITFIRYINEFADFAELDDIFHLFFDQHIAPAVY
ncbi:hypothetical protein [Candidatus Phyllobacterium onerii]|uniref:hypothetical protein n=1 Tax=Candidatus Phyllobacterium onerii TaxID=3020828 RepID=UPI00232EAF53|nr:hypothetical protein [Phyllobacterium sp. IY22]